MRRGQRCGGSGGRVEKRGSGQCSQRAAPARGPALHAPHGWPQADCVSGRAKAQTFGASIRLQGEVQTPTTPHGAAQRKQAAAAHAPVISSVFLKPWDAFSLLKDTRRGVPPSQRRPCGHDRHAEAGRVLAAGDASAGAACAHVAGCLHVRRLCGLLASGSGRRTDAKHARRQSTANSGPTCTGPGCAASEALTLRCSGSRAPCCTAASSIVPAAVATATAVTAPLAPGSATGSGQAQKEVTRCGSVCSRPTAAVCAR